MQKPRLDRPLRLSFFGDTGAANLHRVAGWLSNGLIEHSAEGTITSILSGRGGFDAAFAVGRRQADVALATPAAYVQLAIDGRGPFSNEVFPGLRGLGVIPQDDRLIFAVRRKLGVASFEDIRRRKPPLRIALSADDGVTHFGYAAHRALEAHGIFRHDVEAWGGAYVEAPWPHHCVAAVREQRADAILHEAVMTPRWHEMVEKEDMEIIPYERSALDRLRADHGLPEAVLRAGYYPSVQRDVPVLEFSDFLVFAREDLPEDIAYLLAFLMVQTREELERQYRHIPAHLSAVSYPLVPERIARTLIPLHPGAERYYREIGVKS